MNAINPPCFLPKQKNKQKKIAFVKMATLEQQQQQQQQQHLNPKSHLNLVKDMHPMSRNIDCEVLVLQKGKSHYFANKK